MHVVNVIFKFGYDDILDQSWQLPLEATASLRLHVDVTDEGWVVYEWPVTAEVAAIVQPWVSEPIDADSGKWYVGSQQVPD